MPRFEINIPNSIKNSKNIFLYFDYEREFSGHDTILSDDDVLFLVGLLDQLNFKSTWFTVGQIFLKYPKTIETIRKSGHEIASHTFCHRPPMHTTTSALKKDFEMVKINAPAIIQGFHAPNGRWSYGLLSYLKIYGYCYDVIHERKVKTFIPFYHQSGTGKKIIRLHTIGDDWQLYGKNNNEEEVLKHFIQLFRKTGTGEIAGIGFHPWVLFSDERILKGFKQFLLYLSDKDNVQIHTALRFTQVLDKQ
ncbi:MAG: polysaccharide deacetylase family protein [Desulfobacula sp.]|nr:polysaccharide deacetylase family protein [Desulfobacula sp.]